MLDIVGTGSLLDSFQMVRYRGRVALAGFLGSGAPLLLDPLRHMPSGMQFSFFASAFVFGTPSLPLSDIPLAVSSRGPNEGCTRLPRRMCSTSRRSRKRTGSWSQAKRAAKSLWSPPSARDPTRELAEEVRLGCTQAMLSALKPAQRMVYVLADIFALESEVAAAVLSIEPAAFRKRLQRARLELGGFMERKCGLANPAAACRCVRQIPIVLELRMITRHRLELAGQSREAISQPVAEAWEDLTSIDRAARVFQARRNELACAAIVGEIRGLISSGSFRLFDS